MKFALLAVAIVSLNQAFMDGRCAQLCSDELVAKRGRWNAVEKECDCVVGLLIPLLRLPAERKPLKPSSESDDRKNIQYDIF